MISVKRNPGRMPVFMKSGGMEVGVGENGGCTLTFATPLLGRRFVIECDDARSSYEKGYVVLTRVDVQIPSQRDLHNTVSWKAVLHDLICYFFVDNRNPSRGSVVTEPILMTTLGVLGDMEPVFTMAMHAMGVTCFKFGNDLVYIMTRGACNAPRPTVYASRAWTTALAHRVKADAIFAVAASVATRVLYNNTQAVRFSPPLLFAVPVAKDAPYDVLFVRFIFAHGRQGVVSLGDCVRRGDCSLADCVEVCPRKGDYVYQVWKVETLILDESAPLLLGGN